MPAETFNFTITYSCLLFCNMIMLMVFHVTRMHSSRMRTARSSSHPGGVSTRHPLVLWPSGVVTFWCGGLLLCPSGAPLCYGLLVWCLLTPRRPYQKATFNQKATKPQGHNRRPQQKATPPRPGTPPGEPPHKRRPAPGEPPHCKAC